MLQLIDELKAIPGVVGACIYSSRDGLLESNLPGIFKAERLTLVGKHLAKLYSAGRMSFDDLTDVSLHYDESVVVARELEKSLLLFAICDPAFNHNLLTMSLNLLQEEFNNGVFSSSSGTTTAPVTPVETLVQAVAKSKLQLDARALGLLDDMKLKLGRILGPMAGFIFEEAVDNWEQQGGSLSQIELLLELLDKEIADEEKSLAYRQSIAAELGALQKG